MTCLITNQEGINAIDRLQKVGFPIDTMGAIEGNIDKILAKRFKKRRMSWSPSGVLNLARYDRRSSTIAGTGVAKRRPGDVPQKDRAGKILASPQEG